MRLLWNPGQGIPKAYCICGAMPPLPRLKTTPVCIGLAGGPCAALTADQWKALSEKKGCETVPESNLQSTCISRQEGVKGWCKSPACKDTEGLVRTYKQLKEQWDRTSSSEEKTRLQTEIDEKERAIKEERRTLENGVALRHH